NAILREAQFGGLRLLPEFTEQLAREAAFLTLRRLEWVQRAHQRIDEILRNIAPKQRTLRVGYRADWVEKNSLFPKDNNKLEESVLTGQEVLPSLQDLESNFIRKAGQVWNDEIRNGSTLIGPHRDDWALYLDDRT